MTHDTQTPDAPLHTPDARPPRSQALHHVRFRRRQDARVRWGALAVGSTVGIALWATLYVWGAALFCLTQTADAQSFSAANLALALYGGLSASAALWVGAAVASRTAGATTRQTGALHGLAMWGMANITLVLVVMALGLGLCSSLQGPAAYIVHVGASAVSGGADVVRGGIDQWRIAPALVGMGLVMVTSLALSVWGGIRGVLRPEPERY